MANRKVTLVRLCKTESGWRRYPAAYGKNGRVKPNIVIVNGEEKEFPEGRYQVRYYEGSRMVYKDAGEYAGDASAIRTRQSHLLAAKESAEAAGVQIDGEEKERLSLKREMERFVKSAEDRGSKVAAGVYRTSVKEFLEIIRKTYADELKPEDVLRYQSEMRNQKYSDRTIYNRHANVRSFLKFCKLDIKELAPASPSYIKTMPEVYTKEELKIFFDSIEDERDALVFYILLKCGLREQEAIYLEWRNVDLQRGVLSVRQNPRFDFKIKDREERQIPIPPDLLILLRKYRESHPDMRLVTGTKKDNPNTKMLRTLKRIVKRADLNCGQCESCKKYKECELWFLHKFRSTFVTQLLRSGMDLRTVMKISGHSDLATVMRYLSPAEDDSVRSQVSSIQWM